ncbi:hypothetical protein DN069_30180 [Streptacidiphilus pinicola]|uniref:Uncharacterized protein n=1 Tax=Streptacidiphilus pinicola TaxID=2219663 RepID=A0A2X0K3P4_9ACTN|nr:hypothetical protein [Streptacidiphilus pinicola]RAG81940.1 hypothetical protein DN069_30180 [Streptacidiphilus pinicola]
MTSILNLRKHGTLFVLDDSPSAASVRPHRRMRQAQITVDGRTVEATVSGHQPVGVEVAGLLRLDPSGTHLPGGGGPVTWTMERHRGAYRGSVVRGADRIELRLTRRGGKHVEITPSGVWPDLELVALAASLVLLSRRRHDRLRAMAIAGAGSH